MNILTPRFLLTAIVFFAVLIAGLFAVNATFGTEGTLVAFLVIVGVGNAVNPPTHVLGAVATAAIDTPVRPNVSTDYPVAAATTLFTGALGALDANGRVVKAADTAGLRCAGRIDRDVDNSGGGAGALTVTMSRGCFKYANSVANPVVQASVGKVAYVEDDTTVAITTANKIIAGRIVAIDADGGIWIDTTRQAVAAALVLTSAQNATAAAVDLATSQALANALKANYNQLQADVAALVAALVA
jgi:hypothetical protein